ncbi:MAG: bacillithiol biosynthesis deacetylase BshB1 [Melioribacteraceae bacterium]|nr:bacillithiol biosynthesis deacetylase BshB1 [Melioribacteraceae bacterium]
MNLDILVLTAHPDDAEIGIGGSIAKFVDEGYKVGIVDFTQGELGTRGTIETRKEEAENAKKILGIHVRENLKFPDGTVKVKEEFVHEVIKVIRKYRPKILIAPYYNDRHPDHVGAGLIAKDAMFFAGLPKIKSEIDGVEQEAYRPAKLFYFMMTYEFEPSFIIDISAYIETKLKAILAFKTQFHDPDSDAPETFISKPGFLEMIKSRASHNGFKIRKDFGEPFYCEEDIELSTKDFFQ